MIRKKLVFLFENLEDVLFLLIYGFLYVSTQMMVSPQLIWINFQFFTARKKSPVKLMDLPIAVDIQKNFL